MTERRFRQRQVQGITGRDLGDEYLFYDGAADRVHILNGTARRILLLCDGHRTLAEISDIVAREYTVDRPTALADARETVERLIELGLLETA